MIIDLRDFSGNQIDTDVCVIGGGAAGIAIASEFDHSGSTKVAVLESGGLQFDERIQKLYEGGFSYEGPGFTHSSPDALFTDRARFFGGSTNLWGGMVAPFDEIDFKERPWIENSGWPFSREHLIPYYDRASIFFGVPLFNFSRKSNYPHPLFLKSLHSNKIQSSPLRFEGNPIQDKVFFNF